MQVYNEKRLKQIEGHLENEATSILSSPISYLGTFFFQFGWVRHE